MSVTTIPFEYEDDDGNLQYADLPARYDVCPDCEGKGTTLNENLRGAFTAREFYECFDDEESRAEYFKGGDGIYGVPCKTCEGKRVVPVVDEKACDEALLKKYRDHVESEERYERERRAEIQMEERALGNRDYW